MARITQEELNSLALRDVLSFGLINIDLLDGKMWEVSSRKWIVEPYGAVNPWVIERYPVSTARRMVVTKSTQSGVSSMAMTKMFHFATNWPGRVAYTLPRQQDLLDMVTTRIDPMIRNSPYLKGKLRPPDSVHAKGMGDSYIYFMELSVEPRSLPLDMLLVDEVDLSDPNYMSTAQNRLDASRWKLQMYLSTPTVANYGIDGMYKNSDMREWLVKCPKCNKEQPIDWEVNLRIVGPVDTPTKVFYGCSACNAEITVEHMQTGRWVAAKPQNSDDTVGYHIHQMLTTPAYIMYKLFRDPQTKLLEFYRKRLGKPYELGGGSIERDDFLSSCFDEPFNFEDSYDGRSTYYLGADQGNEIQAIVGKTEPGSNRIKIVHIELIPLERGFDRLAQLMELYHVRMSVTDANPNRHSAVGMVRRFPGRIVIADYVEQKTIWKTSSAINDPALKKVKTNVAIDRTSGFDGLMSEIKNGLFALPGEPPAIHPDVELLIDQTTALKRDVETRKTQSGETQVFVWRKLRADHLAHAMLYLKTAVEIKRGRGMHVSVIKSKEPEEGEPQEETVEVYRPNEDVIREITSYLAEVPKPQLAEFVEKTTNNQEYSLPWPLSYKLKRVRDFAFAEKDILWVANELANQKKKSLTK